MSLIIPTASSTFADSCKTEGRPLARKYVLAQFRSDAEFEWVRQLRSILVTAELKYKKFLEARPKLRTQRELWKKIESGVGQATIVVIDPDPIEAEVRPILTSNKASPDDAVIERLIIDKCATAIIRDTPVSYLPNELFHAVPWGAYQPIASLADFAPENIKKEIGGGLRETMIFAARAHAIFDLPSMDSYTASTRDVFRSPLASILLAELLATQRHFDNENSNTTTVLNRAADTIATALGEQLPIVGAITDKPLVIEVDSKAIDEIQAADIAAGWAREILETNDPKTLGARFDRVWINGRRIK
jgi:hypothetical protein